MIENVKPISGPLNCQVQVPGSKSITNRVLLIAALAHGQSKLYGALISEDTKVMSEALNHLGINVQLNSDCIVVEGCAGRIPGKTASLYTHESGTATRFLIPAVAACGNGQYEFNGTKRMCERPLESLIDALARGKVAFNFHELPGCMPLSLKTEGFAGDEVTVDIAQSSQFLSGLMIAAPYAKKRTLIRVNAPVTEKPYVLMTQKMMSDFAVKAEWLSESSVAIEPQMYQATEYAIEPDMSTASYFFAAAAILGGQVTVKHCRLAGMMQGDVRFLTVLEKMGCRVEEVTAGIRLESSGELKGVEVDMAGFSDTFMTVCAVAAFAKGPTTLHSLAHTRLQESDRVSAIAEGLKRLGCEVESTEDTITIKASALKGATVSSFNDHRIAMSLALIGLKVPGVQIENAEAVSKTCPDYFDRIASLH